MRYATPLITLYVGGGNCTAQGPCYYEDICPTLKAAGPHAVAVISDGKEITRSE